MRRQEFLLLAGVFLVVTSILFLLYSSFPELDEHEKADLKLPRNVEEAKRLGLVLSKYKNDHFYTVLLGIATVYIILQSLAIPGSIFLSVLSGYLFPFYTALLLVCLCSALGALICYFLSFSIGRKLIMSYIPDRIEKWQNEIASFEGYLFFYVVFLRVTPILPNWFINIASPIVDVPAHIFFFGTFFGVAPPSFIFIQAGTTLQRLTSANFMWSWTSTATIAISALVSLLPIIYQRYLSMSSAKAKHA
ncbi:hypothetical protein AB6A40_003049 [Gnathostoma spinigerum]|uniref:VTT domain-containing protein n=1 Tax=Gnathostoma spinigerum TaxID=75299 RepID=A0ABD6E8D5_9BILA